MEKIKEFAQNFCSQKLEGISKIKNSYFLEGDLAGVKDKISSEPFSIGLFMGKVSGKTFVPGVPLLDMLSKLSDRKIFVNKKTEWLFLCSRDIFGRGIIKSNVNKGLVLVQNERNENLGYGEIVADLGSKDKVVVKNLFDKGNFLRREKKNYIKKKGKTAQTR